MHLNPNHFKLTYNTYTVCITTILPICVFDNGLVSLKKICKSIIIVDFQVINFLVINVDFIGEQS
jgi:hypothetical protein